MITALFDSNIKLPKENQTYDSLLSDQDFLSVGATMYSLLKKQNKLHETPEYFQQRLKSIHTDTLFKNIFIKNQTHQLLNEFEKEQIPVIPLKGPLFTERYFSDIGARFSSDIDLLLHKQDLVRATACIKRLGYLHEKEETPSHFNFGFYKEIPNSPCPLAVELHWDLVDENTSNMNMDNIWNEAECYQSSYHYVKQLSDQHTFYMIVLHGWRHNLESMKYKLDIMQMISKLSLTLDYEQLMSEAKQDQTFIRVKRTLSIIYNEYPFLSEMKNFPYVKQDKRRSTTLTKYLTFLNYQFLSYDRFTHVLKELRQWFLPSKRDISVLLGSRQTSSLFTDYIVLYKQRFQSIWKAIS